MIWVLNSAATQPDQLSLVDIFVSPPASVADDAPAADVPSVGAPQGGAQALVLPAHSDEVEAQLEKKRCIWPNLIIFGFYFIDKSIFLSK